MTAESLEHAEYTTHQYKRIRPCDQTENPFAELVPNQHVAIVPSFRLECGTTLLNVPVAYKTYGTLAPNRSNAIVVCHAFTGSAAVHEWWGPLLGSGSKRALDTSRFFVVCVNCLGSPYGSASPVTAMNDDVENGCYGPTFPLTTIRDDVRLFKLLLDDLGIKQIAAVVGGSMGGMHVLEFAYFGAQYVRTIVPIATSAQSSAWSISWGEVQRQSIFSDWKYGHGYYDFDDPPARGLGAARMAALLTYRSRDSFEHRFGRQKDDLSQTHYCTGTLHSRRATAKEGFFAHNEGYREVHSSEPKSRETKAQDHDPSHTGSLECRPKRGELAYGYSAQSYLRYQGEKFVRRFDANCYIAITRKLDTHDVARDRASTVEAALAMIKQPALILGIPNDGLFTYQEQCELSAGIPNARLDTIDSREGHDGFLLEHEKINRFLKRFFERELSDISAPAGSFAHGGGMQTIGHWSTGATVVVGGCMSR